MTNLVIKHSKSIAVILITAMFFSCKNDAKEVRDFLADKNLPIGESYNIDHKHTDSGRIDIKMKAPIMYDFDNRKSHPYSEFPKGIKITTIDKNNDSITIEGEYAKNYRLTAVSELRNNVVIINHKEKTKLTTQEVYWDQKTHYFFTEKQFVFYTLTDTIYGTGFEASEDLKKWWVKNQSGVIEIND
jgi:LPS export ABC transporter protein LptC